MQTKDFRTLIYHMRIAMATGLSKDAAKRYAKHMLRTNYDINHLRVIG